MGTFEQDVADYERQEVANDVKQAMRDTSIEDEMKDIAMFQEFLKESASEDMLEDLFALYLSGRDGAFFWEMVKGFREYCDHE